MQIKSIRIRLGWTQKKMADYVGVRSREIIRWEKGQNKPCRLAQRQIERLFQEWEFLSFKPKESLGNKIRRLFRI